MYEYQFYRIEFSSPFCNANPVANKLEERKKKL